MARIIGIDFGIKRIGVAMSDPLGITAQPLCVLERASNAINVGQIEDLVRKNEVERIVVGLPLNMDGTDGNLMNEVKSFAAALETKIGVPVEMYDERLTTMQAERMLTEEADMSRDKRKQVRDKVAASFILRSYLERSSL